jgi:hypothetical protein
VEVGREGGRRSLREALAVSPGMILLITTPAPPPIERREVKPGGRDLRFSRRSVMAEEEEEEEEEVCLMRKCTVS